MSRLLTTMSRTGPREPAHRSFWLQEALPAEGPDLATRGQPSGHSTCCLIVQRRRTLRDRRADPRLTRARHRRRLGELRAGEGPKQLFPAEPIRFVGGLVVREGVRRKEQYEDAGKEAPGILKTLAGLAPVGYFKVGPTKRAPAASGGDSPVS